VELTPDRKGAIAEAAIAAHAIRAGFDVYRPISEGGRYDLILDVGGRLLRVQCKWAVLESGAVVIRTYSARRAPEGMRVRTYAAADVDVIVAYCDALDACYYLPPELFVGRRQVHLRTSASRNNQRQRVRWAGDYRLEDIGRGSAVCRFPSPKQRRDLTLHSGDAGP
jgi:hypothetical protein